MAAVKVDMGANWANTLHLGAELFPHRGRGSRWRLTSPLIQPFLEAYAQFLNGNRSAAPVACLPRSGSTIHLRRYAGALGCAVEDNDAMRQCAWAKHAVHLARLRADPAPQFDGARRAPAGGCGARQRCGVRVRVPQPRDCGAGGAGASEGWMRLWGAPSH